MKLLLAVHIIENGERQNKETEKQDKPKCRLSTALQLWLNLFSSALHSQSSKINYIIIIIKCYDYKIHLQCLHFSVGGVTCCTILVGWLPMPSCVYQGLWGINVLAWLDIRRWTYIMHVWLNSVTASYRGVYLLQYFGHSKEDNITFSIEFRKKYIWLQQCRLAILVNTTISFGCQARKTGEESFFLLNSHRLEIRFFS